MRVSTAAFFAVRLTLSQDAWDSVAAWFSEVKNAVRPPVRRGQFRVSEPIGTTWHSWRNTPKISRSTMMLACSSSGTR